MPRQGRTGVRITNTLLNGLVTADKIIGLETVCVGGGPNTMDPEEAARACQWLGVSHAIPVHYAHNALVKGSEAGEEFRRAMAQIAPQVQVAVMKPGETRLMQT